MSQIKRKHIEDQAINSIKIDPSDTYTIGGLIVDTTSVTGSIGVGTASPQAGVHVRRVTTSAGVRLDLDDGASGKSYDIVSLPAGSLGVKDVDAASYRLIIDNSGFVGIGKTVPTQKLHLYNGGASAYIAAERSTGTSVFGSDSLGTAISESGSRPIYFASDGAEKMRITGNRVGIGNTNPTYTLTVDGTPSKFADTTVMVELNNISDAYTVKPSSAIQFSVRRAPGASEGLGAIQVTKSDAILNSLDSHMTFHTRQGLVGYDSYVERMRLDATGNVTITGKVGIGTLDPQESLHVWNRDILFQGFPSGSGLNFTWDNGSITRIRSTAPENSPGSSTLYLENTYIDNDDNTNTNSIASMTYDVDNTYGIFSIGTYNEFLVGDALRVDSTGKVGIGTLYPQESLHVWNRDILFQGFPSGSGLNFTWDNGSITRIRSTAPENSPGSSTLYLENTYIDNDDNTNTNSIASMTYDVDNTYGIFSIGTYNEFLVGNALRVDSTNNITITGSVGVGTYNSSTINKMHIDGGSLWLTGGNTFGSPDASVGLRLCYDVAGDKGHIFSWDYTNGVPKDTVFDFGDIYSVPLTDYSGVSTLSGWDTTAGMFIEIIQYRRLGAVCDVIFRVEGESNGIFTKFTLPYKAKNISDFAQYGLFVGEDDSTPLSANGVCYVNPGDNTCVFSSSPGYGTTGGWATSGTKAVAGRFRYEIEL